MNVGEIGVYSTMRDTSHVLTDSRGWGWGFGRGGGVWVSGMDDVPAQAIVFGHPYFVAFS